MTNAIPTPCLLKYALIQIQSMFSLVWGNVLNMEPVGVARNTLGHCSEMEPLEKSKHMGERMVIAGSTARHLVTRRGAEMKAA